MVRVGLLLGHVVRRGRPPLPTVPRLGGAADRHRQRRCEHWPCPAQTPKPLHALTAKPRSRSLRLRICKQTAHSSQRNAHRGTAAPPRERSVYGRRGGSAHGTVSGPPPVFAPRRTAVRLCASIRCNGGRGSTHAMPCGWRQAADLLGTVVRRGRGAMQRSALFTMQHSPSTTVLLAGTKGRATSGTTRLRDGDVLPVAESWVPQRTAARQAQPAASVGTNALCHSHPARPVQRPTAFVRPPGSAAWCAAPLCRLAWRGGSASLSDVLSRCRAWAAGSMPSKGAKPTKHRRACSTRAAEK